MKVVIGLFQEGREGRAEFGLAPSPFPRSPEKRAPRSGRGRAVHDFSWIAAALAASPSPWPPPAGGRGDARSGGRGAGRSGEGLAGRGACGEPGFVFGVGVPPVLERFSVHQVGAAESLGEDCLPVAENSAPLKARHTC